MAFGISVRSVRPALVFATVAAGSIGFRTMARLLTTSASAESTAATKIFNGGPAFVSLPLDSSEFVNHNTKRLRFKLPQDTAISGLPLTYQPGHLELLVKKYPNGKGSGYLHSLAPGDKLRFAAAIPGYKWKPNSYSHITLIAGGAGTTPIYQLAQGILRNHEDKTSMTLVFGVNSDEDILLKEELDQFLKDYPDRFKVIYTLSNPRKGSLFRKGYVDRQLLQEILRPPAQQDTKVFVCGPPAMEDCLLGKGRSPGIIGQLGFRKDQIHKF